MDVIQWILGQAQNMVLGVDGQPYAVEITEPIGFTVYMGMAFVLYAIRETEIVPIRFLPLVSIVIGLLYSCLVEFQKFDEESVVAGIRLALLGIGSVATIKYFLDGDRTRTETKRLKE
ncbi:holin [Neobacillus sp. C211]|uniref:holin n=1 Tax=unclassified Neobacillus TaxID=2675272 RepID=UPI00397E1E6B